MSKKNIKVKECLSTIRHIFFDLDRYSKKNIKVKRILLEYQGQRKSMSKNFTLLGL